MGSASASPSPSGKASGNTPSVAADRLGSAMRWRELAALNYGVPQADGRVLTTEHWIREGWWLELPQRPGGHAATRTHVFAFLRFRELRHLGADRLVGSPTLCPTETVRSSPTAKSHSDLPILASPSSLWRWSRWSRRGERPRPVAESPATSPSRGKCSSGYQTGGIASSRQRLRAGDGRKVVVDADGALAAVAEECRRSGVAAPTITGMTVAPESVEVLVDSADGLADLKWLRAPARA